MNVILASNSGLDFSEKDSHYSPTLSFLLLPKQSKPVLKSLVTADSVCERKTDDANRTG